MSIVARMHLAIAVVEKFSFESVGEISVSEEKAVILLHENAEFYKAAPVFEEAPIDGGGTIIARLTAEVNGVRLVAYKHSYEMDFAS
ncbi:MAG: hypothetical protein ABS939_15145 [Psychrobacillus sp.]